jgi:hypothetical protein
LDGFGVARTSYLRFLIFLVPPNSSFNVQSPVRFAPPWNLGLDGEAHAFHDDMAGFYAGAKGDAVLAQ